MKQLAILTLSMALATPGLAQTSNIMQRKANYLPEGRTFVCENGNNRYTRALYGSMDEYRIETSDRPIFAIYKKNCHRNIRFRIKYDGKVMQVDSAEYCKAIYEAGRRDYILRDKRWGMGELRLSVLAYPETLGGIWKFTADGFDKNVEIEGLICETVTSKFGRFGDIGRFDKPGGFEAPAHPKMLQIVWGTIEIQTPTVASVAVSKGKKKVVKRQGLNTKLSQLQNSKDLFFSVDSVTLSSGTDAKMLQRFEAAEKWRKDLSSTISITTPDPYLNPIGGAMVMAADGAWDGKVWLHGAIGWRMPLNGWRAAYMGDFLGMPDRQRIHFDAYAKSQVTDVPVNKGHLMDAGHGLSRGAYK